MWQIIKNLGCVFGTTYTSSKQGLGLINPGACTMMVAEQTQGYTGLALSWQNQTRGVFQKAGYVTYLGMFEYKRADNLSFRFQNQR